MRNCATNGFQRISGTKSVARFVDFREAMTKGSPAPMAPSTAWRPIVITVYPDTPAPALRCPQCDVSLVYSATAVSRHEQLERWDRLECHDHGAFVYRHRTRNLRPDNHSLSKQPSNL